MIKETWITLTLPAKTHYAAYSGTIISIYNYSLIIIYRIHLTIHM